MTLIPKIKKAILGSILPFKEKINLVIVINETTIIVGIKIHILSNGFLSAYSNNMPQEKATEDMSPIG